MVRQAFDILTKKQILDEIDKGTKYEVIKTKFNLKNNSNINRIKNDRLKILQSFNSTDSPLKKSLKKSKYENIDQGLRNFIDNCNNNGVPVNATLLKEKAKELSEKSGQFDFKASNGYIYNFANRKNVFLKTIHGESGSVDPDIMINWKIKLSEIIANTDPENIFNGDELGLFWRMFPNKTYTIKDKVCRFGKLSKERVTALVVASMMGEKLPIVVIGKSAEPRNFRNLIKLNIQYYHNEKAWMTAELFTTIIEKLNKIMMIKKRFIILFVDNCSAHPKNLNFSNVKICFLPANTTSVSQPMDAGVIKCLKGYYRTKLCRKLIALLDENQKVQSTSIKLFDSIEMLCAAWDNDLKPSVISNCFRHCGFFQAKVRTEPIEPEEENCNAENEFEKLATEFSNQYPDGTLEDFVDVDKKLSTYENLDEIFPENSHLESQEVSDSGDEENNVEDFVEDNLYCEKKITKIEALELIDRLKLYCTQSTQIESNELINLLRNFENKVYEKKTVLIQKKLEF